MLDYKDTAVNPPTPEIIRNRWVLQEAIAIPSTSSYEVYTTCRLISKDQDE
jgi:hypothetical protein